MQQNLFSNLVVRSIACFGLLAAVSNATAAIISLNGTLVGQVTTPIPTGSGSASIIIDTVARTLVFEATYQGLNNNVSASHIHAAATATPYVFPTGANWATALNFSGSPSSTGVGAAPASWGPNTYTPLNLSTGFVTAQGGDRDIAFDNFVNFLTTGQAYYNLHTSLDIPTVGAGSPGGSLGTFFTTAVPEPSSCAMVIASLACGVFRRRRAR
jgi:hypothetical protein